MMGICAMGSKVLTSWQMESQQCIDYSDRNCGYACCHAYPPSTVPEHVTCMRVRLLSCVPAVNGSRTCPLNAGTPAVMRTRR